MNDAALGALAALPAHHPERKAAERRAWFGFLAMVLGNFMAVLDIQIVASSINELQAGLSASPDEIQWIQTSYLIAEVIAIPLSGYLSRMLSTRIYFVISAVGFTLASVACAFSWSLGSMVFFRILQGFLGGGMIPTTFAAMFMLFPAEKRIVPQVLAGMTTTLAPSLGPTIGGYLTDSFSWHWLFLVNVLPGMLCASAVWALLHVDKPQPEMLKRIDLQGLLYMALFLGGFEYSLDEGPRHDWFSDDSVAVMAVMATIAGALFFWRTLTTAHPIVELRAFRNANFAIGSLLCAVLGMSMYTLVYLTPLFLGRVRGYDALQIGQVMMVQGVAMFFSGPIAAQVSRVMPPRLMMAFGLLAVGIGSWLNGHLTSDWGFAQFALPQALRGFGFLFCFIPMTHVALGTLPPEEVKNGSGLFSVCRNLGGALGLASINTLINRQTWQHWQDLTQSVNDTRAPVREALSATQQQLAPVLGSADHAGALAMLARQVSQQVAVLTFNDMYQLLGIAAFLSLLLLPVIRKPRLMSQAETADAH